MKTSAIRAALMLVIVAWPVSGVEAVPGQSGSKNTEGLRRCVGADGGTIFTDRRCEDLQAIEGYKQGVPEPPGVLVRVRSCARSQDDLLFGVRAALENNDPNRLAEFYHWTGMGNAQGYRVLDRLSAFSKRPVVDVQLVSSAPQDFESGLSGYFDYDEVVDVEPMGTDSAFDAEFDPDAAADEDLGTSAGIERPPVRRRAADLLRVDQMRGEADIASETTYFHLLSNAGCWWMRF